MVTYAVLVGTAPKEVVQSDPSRRRIQNVQEGKGYSLYNNSDSVIYVDYDAPCLSTGSGFPIPIGTVLSFDPKMDPTEKSLWAVTTGANKDLRVII